MKIDLGQIEINHKQLVATNATTILAAQHCPPYTSKEIKDAAEAAAEIIWRVKGFQC